MTDDPVIRFEVALEAINRECVALESELREERKKIAPSQALIDFLNAEINALMDLSVNLRPDEVESVFKILQKFVFSRRPELHNV
jgi:hypothetical protein